MISASEKADDGLRYSFVYIFLMTVLPSIALMFVDEKQGIADAAQFAKDRPRGEAVRGDNKTDGGALVGIAAHAV